MTEKEDPPVVDDKTAKARKKVEDKVGKKVDDVIDKGANPKKAIDIVGDVTPPDDPSDPEDVKAFFDRIDQKLDRLLEGKGTPPPDDDDEEEEEIEDVPPPVDSRRVPILYWED